MISVITVCYNSEKTITKTFDSILEQTTPPSEYIVIDGNSNDNTIAIIEDYEQKFLKKNISFNWISEKDNGIYDAMNKGLKFATKEWIHFLNSDDYYLNKYVLKTVCDNLEKTNADVIYGQLIKIENDVESALIPSKEKKLNLNSLIGCPIYQPATFFNHSLFKNKFTFDTKFKISADYKLFLQMINKGVRFQYIPIFTTYFNDGGISTIHQKTFTHNEDLRVLIESNKPTLFMKLMSNRFFYKPIILLFKVLSKF
ncbi:glycosyltransferase involved in cell wall biosynthesis [Parabacteroides sp. PF5-5]|uniref:glycosyltransferase family 2 protein n=1 Tax=unclassified Parabacteroides TaxID=2649774 RepID=UPI0024765237|nr:MULTISPECIES: glycosyltransferase family 2 protein [unclassified Parabacteroides]MDH6306789.1 glycosyltransferase involved in cell wall biosynthesis [Parabacteroides sp. PH5-39]MDH6317675.1 glycosyltransferase involved in cell wall biosynthesis [Parabacteroides sp. PF5-13]MDH6321501.1 glycosyltransferase involved in cell wall biosynthesis [Parabacteroides sp. PH5-13]MDH6325222.1 glycosyltransferase involved in cell wall biosynthesis [Parabacteroides sp. PH5-8]MDH6328860.1 glycosyltransferas